MNKLGIAILMIGIVCFSIHCADEPEAEEKKETIQSEQLQGYWEVVKAERDEKPTQLLDNTSFYFSGDSMQTNLPTQEGKAAYVWAEDDIIRQADDITTYTVHSLNKDSMEFSVTLQGFNFDMTLLKIQTDSLK